MSDAFDVAWSLVKGYDIDFISDADFGIMPPISGATHLRDRAGNVFPMREIPHVLPEGMSYHTEPSLHMTYNYNHGWGGPYPEGFTIRDVYGKTGEESIPILTSVLQHLEQKAKDEHDVEMNEDWIAAFDGESEKGRWEQQGIEGIHNAAEPLRRMIAFARHDPTGVWRGD